METERITAGSNHFPRDGRGGRKRSEAPNVLKVSCYFSNPQVLTIRFPVLIMKPLSISYILSLLYYVLKCWVEDPANFTFLLLTVSIQFY